MKPGSTPYCKHSTRLPVTLVAGTIILSINWTVGDLAGFVGTGR